MKNESQTTVAKSDVYQIITDRILAMLEQGTAPWRKPWNFTGKDGGQLPRNYVSKKAYNGLNVWILLSAGFDCPFFLSYKQASELGGQVRKGEKGIPVVFWKRLPKLKDGKPVLNDKGKPEMVFFLRYYTVFNLTQCDGINWEKPAPVAKPEGWNPISEAQTIADNMPNAPILKHGGSRAFYSPALDMVGMPEQASFPVPAEYYSTLFHELTHSTGHKSRLARKGVDAEGGDWEQFGSKSYGKEELVAEMGASYLCAFAGIEQVTLDNSAAYLANWIRAIKEDSKLVVMAAAQAQKAADYIRNVTKEETTED